MLIDFPYHTKDLHKLVEMVARVCYQSYSKVGDNSHTMLKGIMSKGHLSVASVGNLVFTFKIHDIDKEYRYLLDTLTTFKEINNYVRWSFPNALNSDSDFSCVLSMNILSLLDINQHFYEMYTDENIIFDAIMEYVKEVPYLYWFFDSSTEVSPVENPYFAEPSMGNPIVLAEDYTKLEEILTPYELDIHATITVDIVTDRAVGLQMWRHADMTGGCELSQRYVDRGNAGYRIPQELDKSVNLLNEYNILMQKHIDNYIDYQQYLINDLGVTNMRAKEISRNLLPCVETRILHCRPLRQWKHFFGLRCTPHAQPEMQLDAYALRDAFKAKGIKIVDKAI